MFGEFLTTNKYTSTVPLMVTPQVINGKQCLIKWSNGTYKVVAATVMPWIYSKRPVDKLPEDIQQILTRQTKITPVQIQPLGKTAKEEWFKIEFQNEIKIKVLKKMLRESLYSEDEHSLAIKSVLDEKNQQVANLNTNYIDHILIQKEDSFVLQEPQSIKTVTFDIEQYTDGGEFPPRENPIISISAYYTDGPGINPNDIKHYQLKSGADLNDKEIIKAFIKDFQEYSPDVIIGFNENFYDLPVLLKRMQINGLNTKVFDRFGKSEIFFYEASVSNKDITKARVDGRLFYDVHHAVQMDQTLHGKMKNKRLKTVAKYFQLEGIIPADIEIIEEEMHDNRHLIGTDRLKEYNNSDVIITKYLFDTYFKNNLAVAEFTKCSLDKVVPLASSYPFTIVGSRVLKEFNIISTARNKIRNDKYWPYKGKPFQGADSDAIQIGRFDNLFEYDVSSMYPHIIVSLGLGPDNTRIIRTLPFNSAKLLKTYGNKPTRVYDIKVNRIGNRRIYYVPDQIRKLVWEIEVTGRSPIADKTAAFIKQRMELKTQSKAAEKEHNEALSHELYILAYGLKVILNAEYGGAGDPNNPIGELAVAALITAVGRRILAEGVDTLDVSTCLLFDTDGIKSLKDVNESVMNEATDKLMQEKLFGLPVIKWEKESFNHIYVHRAKNYLLLKENDKLVKHGVAFHSSKQPLLFDKIIDEVGPLMLKLGHSGLRKIVARYFNLTKYDKKLFIQTVKPSDNYESYQNKNAQAPALMKKYEAIIGRMPHKGTELKFVVTTKGYEPPTPEALNRLDMDYYTNTIIGTSIELLGFHNTVNQTVSKFVNIKDTTRRRKTKKKVKAEIDEIQNTKLFDF